MTAAPSRSSLLLPTAAWVDTRPGTAPSVRPRSCAKSAVISVPEDSPASTTTVIRPSAAISRLRAGKLQRYGRWPGRQLGDDQPALGDLAVQVAVRARVDDVGASREHRDRRAADAERATVGGPVDAKRQAADRRDPRRRRGHARGRRRRRSRRASRRACRRSSTAGSGRAGEQLDLTAAEEDRRLVVEGFERGRIALVVHADRAHAGMAKVRAGAARLEADRGRRAPRPCPCRRPPTRAPRPRARAAPTAADPGGRPGRRSGRPAARSGSRAADRCRRRRSRRRHPPHRAAPGSHGAVAERLCDVIAVRLRRSPPDRRSCGRCAARGRGRDR